MRIIFIGVSLNSNISRLGHSCQYGLSNFDHQSLFINKINIGVFIGNIKDFTSIVFQDLISHLFFFLKN